MRRVDDEVAAEAVVVRTPGSDGQPDLAEVRGVVHWPGPDSPADIEQVAERLGWRCILLDGSEVEDRDGFLEMCAQAFALPEWFEMSWDALEECLADLDAGDGLVVVWSDWAGFAEADPVEYATAVDVLTDTARRFAVEGAPYAVLMLGEDLDDADPLAALDLLADDADDLDDVDEDADFADPDTDPDGLESAD